MIAMAKNGRGRAALALITGAVVATIDLYAALTSSALIWLLLGAVQSGRASFTRRSLTTSGLRAGLPDNTETAGAVELVEVRGPLLFVSAAEIDTLLPTQPPWPSYLVLDLRGVTSIDGTALRALDHVLACLETRDGQFALICSPGSKLWTALQRTGFPQRALGGTSCFTLAHALERVAARQASHACQSERASSQPRARGALRLVLASAEPAD